MSIRSTGKVVESIAGVNKASRAHVITPVSEQYLLLLLKFICGNYLVHHRQAAVHGVAEGRTRLSDFTFTFHFHALEKEMATHSSVLAWRIPGMAEPGGLPTVGSHRVGHD